MGRKGMYRIQLRPAFPPIKRSDKEVTCDCYFSRSVLVLEGGRTTNCSTCVGTFNMPIPLTELGVKSTGSAAEAWELYGETK